MTKSFKVEICRIGYAVKTIELNADNAEQAANDALDEAGDHLYSEHHSEYEVTAVYDAKTGAMEEYGVDAVKDLRLEAIQAGLGNAVSVGEHIANYPMTDADGSEYDSDTDPSIDLCDSATMAARIIKTLIANPDLAGKVLAHMKS